MGNYRDLNDYEVMYLVEENDDDAKDLLYQKYKPLILSIALEYRQEAKECGLEMDDLIQEGYVGLYNASKNYNSKISTLFYTYAMISIKSKIINCLKGKNALRHRILNQSISLYHPIPNTDQCTLMDLIEDKNALLPHFLVEENDTKQRVKNYLFSLDFPHSLIFELKCNGFNPSDISQLLDLPLKKVSNILFSLRKDFQSYLSND